MVFVVTDNFIHDAKSGAEDTGMPRLRMVTVPADEYYKRRVSREEIKPVAVAAVNALIDGLTRPLDERRGKHEGETGGDGADDQDYRRELRGRP